MRHILALAMLLAVPGCSCRSESVSGIYGEGVFVPSDGVHIVQGEATLDFGSVAFGERLSGTVLLDSVGHGDLIIAATSNPDPPFSLESLSQTSLRPGERLAIKFQFAPPRADEEFSASRAYESEATLTLANTESPTALTIHLRGQGVPGEDCLHLSPKPLDFGTVRAGCFAKREVNLSNGCNEPVVLNGVEVLGTGFSVTPGNVPEQLAPGDEHALSARFDPAEVGIHQGLLRVLFGSGEDATARRLPLAAVAVQRPRITESFVATRSVDVLVVAPWLGAYSYVPDADGYPVYPPGELDGDEAHRGLMALLSGLLNSGVDFHLGFLRGYWDYFDVTPEEERPGWVRGSLTAAPDTSGPLIFASSTPNLLPLAGSTFFAAATSSDGTADQSMQGCFESARRAVTDPLSSGANAGFARDGVPLVVVCFDELHSRNQGDWSTTIRPDQEDYWIPLPVQFYVDALADARGGPHRVSISAIGYFAQSDSADCELSPPFDTSRYRSANPFRDRLVEAAHATGGLTIDWCEPWGEVLLDQQPWVALQRKFRLAETPDLRDSMEVRVAGVLLAPSQWNIDSTSRVIELKDLPSSGAEVEVTYTPVCPP